MTSIVVMHKIFERIHMNRIQGAQFSNFLKYFSGSWMSANEEQRHLLIPSAQKIIDTYRLEALAGIN